MLKRARFFITIQGRFPGSCTPDNPALRDILSDASPFLQPSLYDRGFIADDTTASSMDSGQVEQRKTLPEPDVLQLATSA